MSAPDQELEIPTFFGEGAFAATRLHYSGITYDPDLLDRASSFMYDEIGRGLPGQPDNLAMVWRFGEPGYMRPEPDPNFDRANPNTPYVPAGQLELGPDITPTTITRARILGLELPVMQVNLKDGNAPNIGAVAESVLFAPPEDHRMWAGAAAWARQVKEAFVPREAVGNKRRIMEEVTARYAGAVVLEPRRQR